MNGRSKRLARALLAQNAVSPTRRKWTLTVHIVASVGLLGDTAAILVLGTVAARTGDPHLAHASYRFMRLLIPMFGIPLTLIALTSGLMLATGSGPVGLRRFWVRAKLLLVLAVIGIGALLLAPVAFPSGQDGGAAGAVVGSALDVAALLSAVWLAVFKPNPSGGRAAASAETR